MRNSFLIAALSALALSACDSADVMAPETAPAVAAPAVQAAPMAMATADGAPSLDAPARHVVLFRGRGVPASFEADVAALGGTVVYSHRSGFALVSGIDEASGLASLRDVAQVAEDVDVEMAPEADGAPEAAAVSPAAANPGAAAFIARQWDLPAIGMPAVWAAGRFGSSDVTVAVIDSGIDYISPDLAGRVDLDRSVSFLPEMDAYVNYYFPGAHPIADLGYHGTHVASTIASNGLVHAGVTRDVTLMGIKACYGINTSCSSGAILAGIAYAIDHDADVINMSLGGRFAKAHNGAYVGFLNRLFNEANREGVTVVVSAGNESWDLDHDGNTYKTYCTTPGTICVSATGPTARQSVNGPWADIDAPATYTNFGRSSVSVAAPGGNTGGSITATCSKFSLVVPVCQTGNYVLAINGTSMASPHVAGLAALLVEDFGRNPGRIQTKIQQSADDLGQRGTDPYYGKGRINVARALGL